MSKCGSAAGCGGPPPPPAAVDACACGDSAAPDDELPPPPWCAKVPPPRAWNVGYPAGKFVVKLGRLAMASATPAGTAKKKSLARLILGCFGFGWLVCSGFVADNRERERRGCV